MVIVDKMDNKADNKRIMKNSIYLYIRLFLAMGIGLYTSRVVLDVLGVDDFGLYSLVGGFVSMLTVLTGTFSGTAARFITYEIGVGNPEILRRTTSTIINLLIIVSIGVFIFGTIFGVVFIDKYLNIPSDRINAAYFVYLCSLFVFSMNLLAVPYQAIITAHEHMNFYAMMSVFESIAKLIVVLSLSCVSFDKLYFYALLFALISVLSRIMYGVYCNHYFVESRYHFLLDKSISKRMTSFSIWMGIGTASGIFKDQGLSVIINIFFNLAVNAARGISLQVMSVFNAFALNIGLAMSPQITKSYSQGNIERSINLTFLSAKSQGYLILVMMIPFLLESHYILTIWLKSFPEYTQEFVCWGVLISFVHVITSAFGPIYLAMGRIRNLQLAGSITNFLFLPICFLCCKEGLSIMVCVQFAFWLEIILLFMNCFFLKKEMNFPIGHFSRKVVLPMILVGVITLCVVSCVKIIIVDESLIRLLLSSITSLIVFSISVYFIGITDSEKKVLIDLFSRKLNRITSKSRI